MIELKNVTKKYDDRVIIDDLSLTIKDGEFVVFSGPSGCGKTTLLHLIGTIEPASSGTILINGKDIRNRRNQEHVLKYDIGFLFQNFALVDKKTVRDNILLVPKICRSGITVEEALDFVGLANLIDTRVYKLSGGEQQRVALARLLFKKCSIILADEPTGSLDSKNADTVMRLLKDMSKEGKTVIVVTHAEQYLKMADRVCSLANKI